MKRITLLIISLLLLAIIAPAQNRGRARDRGYTYRYRDYYNPRMEPYDIYPSYRYPLPSASELTPEERELVRKENAELLKAINQDFRIYPFSYINSGPKSPEEQNGYRDGYTLGQA